MEIIAKPGAWPEYPACQWFLSLYQYVRLRVGSTLIGTRDTARPESAALKPPMMNGTCRVCVWSLFGGAAGTCTSTNPVTGLGGRPPPASSIDSGSPQNSG